MSKIEKALKALNVEIKRYAIYEDSVPHLVTVGGMEVLSRQNVEEISEITKDTEKIVIDGSSDNERILLPFRYAEGTFDVKHLEELSKFRNMKSLSKEESLNYEVVSKDKAINKIVYIHDKDPSTNSLALAKQFQIRHKNVIQQLFKLAEQNPSILMGIKYGVYELVNNGQSPENQSAELSADSNLGISTFRTFLHISEDVYYNFINDMGTPKSKEMRVYRYEKRLEYLKGFQNLRERLYGLGYKEKEMEEVIRVRTEYTNELVKAINDYVTHYNNNAGVGKQIDTVSISRLVFNLANSLSGIHARTYVNGPINRDVGDISKQNKLQIYEIRMTDSLIIAKNGNNTLGELMVMLTGVSKENLIERLRDYSASDLVHLID